MAEESLKVSRKTRRYLHRTKPGKYGMLAAPNERWSVDFVTGFLLNGTSFRALTMIDEFTRECLAIQIHSSFPARKLLEVLDRMTDLPHEIKLDNGPEFRSSTLECWAQRNRVHLNFIEPGKPTQNGMCESFNGRFRDECLNAHAFSTLGEARLFVEKWRYEYNTERPHGSLAYMTPSEFRAVVIAN